MLPQARPGQSDLFGRQNLRRLAAVGGALALAAFLFTLASRRQPPEKLATAAGFTFSTAKPGPPSAMPTPPVMPGELDDAALTFDAFMSALKERDEDPAAKAFAQRFMEEPALKQIVREFQDPNRARQRGSAREFFQALAERPEFRQLVAQFRSSPGSGSVLARLGSIPGMTALMRSVLTSARAAPSARAGRQGLAARAPPRGMERSALGRSGVAGYQASAPAPGLAASAGPAMAAPVPQVASALPGAGAPPPSAGPGGQAQNIVPLSDIGGAGEGVTQDLFMSICIKQAAITRAECKAIDDHLGPHGIWDACWLTGLYDKCVDLCASVAELKCGGTSLGWVEACKLARAPAPDRDATCATDCWTQGRTDCPTPPPAPAPAPGDPPAAPAAPTSYTIKSGDTMTKIVMKIYGITDPKVAYRTALELYAYGENNKASGENPYNPNLIFPGKVLSMPPLPELSNMTIDGSP